MLLMSAFSHFIHLALDIDTREPLLQYYIQPFCIICVLHYLNLILVSAAVSEFSEIFSPLSYVAFSRFRVFMPAIEKKKSQRRPFSPDCQIS